MEAGCNNITINTFIYSLSTQRSHNNVATMILLTLHSFIFIFRSKQKSSRKTFPQHVILHSNLVLCMQRGITYNTIVIDCDVLHAEQALYKRRHGTVKQQSASLLYASWSCHLIGQQGPQIVTTLCHTLTLFVCTHDRSTKSHSTNST